MPPRTRAHPAVPVLPNSSLLVTSPAQHKGESEFPAQSSPGQSGGEEEDPSFDAPEHSASACLSIVAVAAAAEMVPGVILQPPSDENTALVALLTPLRPLAVARPLSEGSGAASPAARPKRRRKHASPPQASPSLGGSRVTLRIPGGGQHIPSVLERLGAAEASPQAPPSPAISVDENLACSILDVISKSIKVQCDPTKMERTVMAILSALPPGADVTALLPKPTLGRLTPFPYISFWDPTRSPLSHTFTAFTFLGFPLAPPPLFTFPYMLVVHFFFFFHMHLLHSSLLSLHPCVSIPGRTSHAHFLALLPALLCFP